MTTRRKEKIQRKIQERERLKEKIRRRAIGQAMNDDGRHFTKPTNRSPSRREKKKLGKINKIIKC